LQTGQKLTLGNDNNPTPKKGKEGGIVRKEGRKEEGYLRRKEGYLGKKEEGRKEV
jgi:hypothetical protein